MKINELVYFLHGVETTFARIFPQWITPRPNPWTQPLNPWRMDLVPVCLVASLPRCLVASLRYITAHIYRARCLSVAVSSLCYYIISIHVEGQPTERPERTR